MEVQLRFGLIAKEVKIETEYFKIYRSDKTEYDLSGVVDSSGWITSYDICRKTKRDKFTRIFNLPRNYTLQGEFLSEEHAKFIVWCYSFLSGMRLSYLDFGFLDAVNVKKSVFCFLVFEYDKLLSICYNYKNDYKTIASIIHMLFISLSPEGYLLQSDKFSYLYTVFDSCFNIIAESKGVSGYIPHWKRIDILSEITDINPPKCFTRIDKNGKYHIVNLRNDLIHESIFDGEPVGYKASYGHDIYELRNYCCKLILYILGVLSKEYKEMDCSSRDCFLNSPKELYSLF